MKVAAIVPAAGLGRRVGGPVPKQFLDLAGCPLLVHTLRVLDAVSLIEAVVLVVPPGMEGRCRSAYLEPYGIHKVIDVVSGGERRQDSVRNGLKKIPAGTELVAVHDAARPLATPDLVTRVIEAAARYGAAIAAVPMQDTPKVAGSSEMIVTTLNRRWLWLAQTPQVFARELLQQALERADSRGINATDESAMVESLGREVRVVEGSWENFKVTTPEQLKVAELILQIREQA